MKNVNVLHLIKLSIIKKSLRHNFQLIRHFVSKNVTTIGNCFSRFYFDDKSIFNKFFIALIMTEKIAQILIKLNTKVNHWFFFSSGTLRYSRHIPKSFYFWGNIFESVFLTRFYLQFIGSRNWYMRYTQQPLMTF